MKITKMFVSHAGFFFDVNEDYALCHNFIKKFVSVSKTQNIKVNFSTKNPKKKGYREIARTRNECVILDGTEFEVCYQEVNFLNETGVNIGDSFWMKVENA